MIIQVINVKKISRIKQKYEFLNWINSLEKFISILEKLNEKKRIKINLCLNEIVIFITILYTQLDGKVEEMKFILKYDEIEEEEELEELLISEIIKMKESENKSEDGNESSEDDKDLDEKKEDSKEKKKNE